MGVVTLLRLILNWRGGGRGGGTGERGKEVRRERGEERIEMHRPGGGG